MTQYLVSVNSVQKSNQNFHLWDFVTVRKKNWAYQEYNEDEIVKIWSSWNVSYMTFHFLIMWYSLITDHGAACLIVCSWYLNIWCNKDEEEKNYTLVCMLLLTWYLMNIICLRSCLTLYWVCVNFSSESEPKFPVMWFFKCEESTVRFSL